MASSRARGGRSAESDHQQGRAGQGRAAPIAPLGKVAPTLPHNTGYQQEGSEPMRPSLMSSKMCLSGYWVKVRSVEEGTAAQSTESQEADCWIAAAPEAVPTGFRGGHGKRANLGSLAHRWSYR